MASEGQNKIQPQLKQSRALEELYEDEEPEDSESIDSSPNVANNSYIGFDKIAADVNIDIDLSIDYSNWVKVKDKIIFVFGVANIIVTCFIIALVPFALPYYYTAQFPVLLLYRLIMYLKDHYQYFFLDFCYYGNSFLIIYLWAFNNDPRIFMIVFSITNGPLLWAIALFRNSLVFHDIAKLTSLFIHLTPALTTFCIRWFSNSPGMERWKVCTEYSDECPVNFLWLLVFPMCFYSAHQIYYYFIVQILRGSKLRSDKTLLTSYRFLIGQKGFVYRAVNCLGRKHRLLMYSVIFWAFSCLTMLLAYAWYNYFWAHLTVMIVLIIVAIWNGGGFYVNVFARTYTKDLAKKKIVIG